MRGDPSGHSLHRLLAQLNLINLLLVVARGLHLTLGFKGAHHSLVLPADLVAKTTQLAALAALLEAEHFQAGGNHNALDLIIRCRHTLEHLHALKSLLAPVQLVWQHASYGAPEHLARSAEVVWALAWVGVHSL